MSVEEAVVKTTGDKATGAGLRGQAAGQTSIATVGKAGVGFGMRGVHKKVLDLAQVKAARTYQTKSGSTRTYQAGQNVGCYDCHNGPNP